MAQRAVVILLLIAPMWRASAADPDPQGPYGSVTQILRTSSSVLGEPLRYPEGSPSVRAVIVTIQPGETTASHRHDTPVFIYMLEGEVSVEYDGRGTRTYRAGDAFMEAMSVRHRATNVGKAPVRILATFLETVPASRDAGR